MTETSKRLTRESKKSEAFSNTPLFHRKRDPSEMAISHFQPSLINASMRLNNQVDYSLGIPSHLSTPFSHLPLYIHLIPFSSMKSTGVPLGK